MVIAASLGIVACGVDFAGTAEATGGEASSAAISTGYTPTTGEAGASTSASTSGASLGGTDTGEPACEGEVLWARVFPGEPVEEPVRGLVVDGAGNAIVAGYFSGTIDLGGGELVAPMQRETIYLAKFDPNGAHVWSRQFGEGSGQRTQDLAVDAGGNLYLTGHTWGPVDFGGGPLAVAGVTDVFVVKLTPDGEHVWSRSFGAPNVDSGKAIAVDPTGAVIVAAETTGVVDLGGGPNGVTGVYGIAIIKLDAAGDHVWDRWFGGEFLDDIYVRDLAVDADGQAVVVGEWDDATIDFGAGPTQPDDTYAIYVVRLAADGTTVWQTQSSGTTGSTVPYVGGVAFGGAGQIHLGGRMSGPIGLGGPEVAGLLEDHDGWIATLSPAGEQTFIDSLAGSPKMLQQVLGLASNPAGEWVIAGNYTQDLELGGSQLMSDPPDDNAYVAKLEADGTLRWIRGLGEAGLQEADRTAIDAAGNVWVAGQFSETLTVGDAEFTTPDSDSFLIKYCP